MPKGKAKKDNPDLYQASAKQKGPRVVSQAVAHRRGGKHRVKSADLTHSIYDDFSYAEVLELAKDRGIYRKDMKKKEMALANKQYDADVQSRERAAAVEQQKREQQQRKIQQQKDDEKQAAIRVKHERAMQKERRRAEGQEVSEDSLDENDIDAEHERFTDGGEYTQENIGQILSDESWDSTSTESSGSFARQTVEPDCRLRLYEWPEWPHEEHMPLMKGDTRSDSDAASSANSNDWQPVKVPYAPLKVITMYSRQKLFLPGQTYPIGVQPDFVPVLSRGTRTAARNGVLLGVLRKATIERATEWAERTQIQGETAIMFLSLPARNEAKNLTEAYDEWSKENRKLLRVKARGEAVPANRAKRHTQRFRNKAKKVVEVYEACQYRPLAVCYVPAYLDYDKEEQDGHVENDDGHCKLDNLFYIRFPGCDVPHYYFWARLDEWSDPTIRNPAWDATRMDSLANPRSSHGLDVQSHSSKKPAILPTASWTRVKIPNATLPTPSTCSNIFKTALIVAEHQLYATGLASTLSHYRKKWTADEKRYAWQDFVRLVPSLYPSGSLPLVPANVNAKEHCLAFKIATIDTLDPDEPTPLSPFQGDEAWTRDDAAYWELVPVDNTSPSACTETDRQAQLEHGTTTDSEPVALYRRASNIPHHHIDTGHRSHSNDLLPWLSQISPKFGPWPIPSVSSKADFEEEWDHNATTADRDFDSLNARRSRTDTSFLTRRASDSTCTPSSSSTSKAKKKRNIIELVYGTAPAYSSSSSSSARLDLDLEFNRDVLVKKRPRFLVD